MHWFRIYRSTYCHYIFAEDAMSALEKYKRLIRKPKVRRLPAIEQLSAGEEKILSKLLLVDRKIGANRIYERGYVPPSEYYRNHPEKLDLLTEKSQKLIFSLEKLLKKELW